ncbi:hypothetical protein H9X96_17430 [Pedobacter sp. N36a]|uniref:hypothetical protein n=1 Tax=Pedobacter sp. N36a TaxID=2767996 RepID=UPI0016576554|nr:hypothetical protein [Pedobacter sp. N36a]MBC8987554.1 hypothetical protein [Pedobacter sp. N36a]
MTDEHRKARDRFLQKHLFHGLKDLNDGFDIVSISYFNEKQFNVVLQRVELLKDIGVYGIEPHILDQETGEFVYYAVDTFENYLTYPQDPEWYMKSFEKFKGTGEELYYSASFYIPGNYLDYGTD